MSGKKNRKKRKAESNNSKQKVLSRRNFAIGTAVAIPVFGFLGFKIFSSHQENLPSEQGLDYRLKVSRSPNTNILVGEQDIMSMKKEFDRIVNYVQDKKKVKVLEMDVTFLNGEISYEILDSEPSPDLIPLAKELVADALDFWKHPKLRTPVLSFQIPSTVREIKKFPPYYLDQNVTINLIKSWFSNYFFEFKAFTDNGDFEFRANIRSKPSGTAVRDYSFSGNNLAVRRNEVFWVVTKERKYCLDTPAMEVFHNQISEYTDKIVASKLHPDMTLGKVNETIADIAGKTEESLVHGIGLEWYVQANRKFKLGERFGFTEQELLKSSRRRVEEKEKEAVRKMTIDSSPQKVLSLYIDNHEEFLKVRERYMQKI